MLGGPTSLHHEIRNMLVHAIDPIDVIEYFTLEDIKIFIKSNIKNFKNLHTPSLKTKDNFLKIFLKKSL